MFLLIHSFLAVTSQNTVYSMFTQKKTYIVPNVQMSSSKFKFLIFRLKVDTVVIDVTWAAHSVVVL